MAVAASDDDESENEELVSKEEPEEELEDPWYECIGRAYWLELKRYLGIPGLLFQTKLLLKSSPMASAFNLSCNGGGMANSCSICLDGFEAVVVPEEVILTICLHVCHTECISKWLCKTNSCPVCRRKHPLLLSKVVDFCA